MFDADNLFFYPDESPDHPDEISIVIVYKALTDDNTSIVTNGVYIYLDNYLGELNALETIDELKIVAAAENGESLIPIAKLKDYLSWRQKEFLKKYEGTWHDDEDDEFALLKGKRGKNTVMIAAVNRTLLQWDRKASHPWRINISITYKGKINGMPRDKTADELEKIQETIVEQLIAQGGCLFIGRDTANNVRTIYLACREFRQPSKFISQNIKDLETKLDIDYVIFKDKYWHSLDHFC